jgi:hypothetical protein
MSARAAVLTAVALAAVAQPAGARRALVMQPAAPVQPGAAAQAVETRRSGVAGAGHARR